MKKIFLKIALLISCVSICGSCGKANNNNSSASINYTDTSHFDFNDVNSGYSIKLKSVPNDGIVVIPSSYNGKSITGIEAYGFSNFDGLIKVVIPNSVAYIGDYAFSTCSKLTTITFEDESKLPYISKYAFLDCISLTSINIPDSVTYIYQGAFCGCSSLTSLYIPDSVEAIALHAFYACNSLTIYCEASVKPSKFDLSWDNGYMPIYLGIAKEDIIYQNGLQFLIIDGKAVVTGHTNELPNNVIIPSSITKHGTKYSVSSIGKSAFYYCKSVYSIIISSGVKYIDYSAFYNCSSLISVDIPNSVSSIEDNAFAYCSSLASINIPNSVISISNRAFSSCSSLPSINIPNNVTNIGEEAFEGCSSLSIYCEASSQPSGWESNWNDSNRPVYWGVTQKNLIEQNGLLFLVMDGKAVVTGRTNELPKNIVIPKTITIGGTKYNVTSIGEEAFEGCSSLTSVTIPNSVSSIGKYAFCNCNSLTSITIPNSVSSIEDHAFAHCSSLTSIEIPNSVSSIENRAFSSCSSLTSVTIPNSVSSIGDDAFEDCCSLTSINIPNSVTSIGYSAFSNCSSLTSITIPNSVSIMENNAFRECNSLTIYCEANSQPSGWESNWNDSNRPVYWGVTQENVIEQNGLMFLVINGNAIVIGYTNELSNNVVIPRTITIDGTKYNVTSIGKEAFSHCSYLTSVTIPDGITSIGSYAFFDCRSLTSVTIPNSVTSIESYAFHNYKSLTIYCEASNQPSGWDSSWKDYCNSAYWGVMQEDIITQNGIQFLIIDGNAVITGYTSELSNNVVIPETITIDGTKYNVTSIGMYAFFNCNSITSITIPNNISNIGYNAFYDCDSLTIYCEANSQPSGWSYDWRDNDTPIYWGITQKDIITQNGMQFLIIDGNAVVTGHTNELPNNVVIPETITVGGTTYNVTNIGDKAFAGCSSVTSIVIPSSVTSVGSYAFQYCSSLTIFFKANEISEWGRYWNYSDRPVYWENDWSYVDGIPTPNN